MEQCDNKIEKSYLIVIPNTRNTDNNNQRATQITYRGRKGRSRQTGLVGSQESCHKLEKGFILNCKMSLNFN